MSSKNGHVCNDKGQEIEVIIRKGFRKTTRIIKCTVCGKTQRKEPL